MTLTIRGYEPADLEQCRDLWRDLTQRHRDIYEDQTIGGDDPGLYFDEVYLKDPKFHSLFVADEDGVLLGMCGLFDDGYEAELEPICVRPAHRDKRVGAALAQHVIEVAKGLGRGWINVRPVWRNIEAIAFFAREGFDHLNHVTLSMRLDDGPSGASRREIDVHGVRFSY